MTNLCPVSELPDDALMRAATLTRGEERLVRKRGLLAPALGLMPVAAVYLAVPPLRGVPGLVCGLPVLLFVAISGADMFLEFLAFRRVRPFRHEIDRRLGCFPPRDEPLLAQPDPPQVVMDLVGSVLPGGGSAGGRLCVRLVVPRRGPADLLVRHERHATPYRYGTASRQVPPEALTDLLALIHPLPADLPKNPDPWELKVFWENGIPCHLLIFLPGEQGRYLFDQARIGAGEFTEPPAEPALKVARLLYGLAEPLCRDLAAAGPTSKAEG